MVAPSVERLEVGGDGVEEVGDFGEVGGDFFGDGRGDRRLELADTRGGFCLSNLRVVVFFMCGDLESGTYRWSEKMLVKSMSV